MKQNTPKQTRTGPRILASKLRQIGDAVLWSSALLSLRDQFPDATIEVLSPSFGPQLFAHHPAVDKVHVVGSGRLALARTIFSLIPHSYDYFFGFHANTSLCRLAPFIRAREKILHHHSRHESPWANTRSVPAAGALEHVIRRDHRLLEAIGIFATPPLPKLFITDAEKESARKRLADRGAPNLKGALVLLPGARASTRRYPAEMWKEYVGKLVPRMGKSPTIVIADSEQATAWNLEAFCKTHSLILFSDLTLREVLSVISVSERAVGNDSGLIHAAAALGLETLSLFGAGCLGDFLPPDPKRNHYLRINVDCRSQGPRDQDLFQYCTLTTCDHHSCLRKLHPQAILDHTPGL